MSAIATFTKLPKTSLEGLRQAVVEGDYHEFLEQNGTPAAEYDWSGYVLATLLPYLDEQQIHLGKSEHDDLANFLAQAAQGTSFIFFTEAHRQAYLSRLQPESFSEEVLRDYCNEFNASDEPDAGQPMLDGIRAFHECLSAVDANSVIVLSIG